MKKTAVLFAIFFISFALASKAVFAQAAPAKAQLSQAQQLPTNQRRLASPTPSPSLNTTTGTSGANKTATSSATASESAALATPSAIVQQIVDTPKQDITQNSGEPEDRLVTFLKNHPPQPLSWNNFLEIAIRHAIDRGVPASILVLVLLFPLIASIIAASRHVIGLRGFGIYIPAVLSVALVSTGLLAGIIIFLAIIAVAMLSKRILKPSRLSYLPRTALLLWMISLTILGVLLLAPYVNLAQLMTVNIFPILILVLLSENFLDAQSSTKPADAFSSALETLGLAFVSGLILRWQFLQQIALLEPELLLILTAVFNLLVGKFTGLRVTEWLRFRSIIEE